jgi:hypothetical protein
LDGYKLERKYKAALFILTLKLCSGVGASAGLTFSLDYFALLLLAERDQKRIPLSNNQLFSFGERETFSLRNGTFPVDHFPPFQKYIPIDISKTLII